MQSSSRVLAFVLVLSASAHASALEQPQGFNVERLYLSPPGGGWLVMDDLDLYGKLGGALALTVGYANQPLRVSDGAARLAVVSDRVTADIGAAITWDRWRWYLGVVAPLAIRGASGSAGDYSFTGPSLDFGSNPDEMGDARLGGDVRVLGKEGGPFRLGAGAQLIIPFGNRSDYVTDGTFRGMIRALAAGDVGHFTYAAQIGAHIRPLDDSPAPGSPKGSEWLVGCAAGIKWPMGRKWAAIVGPELYAATAFRAFFDAHATALEGLLTGRVEGNGNGLQARVKLGAGGGLAQRFGAAEWRLVLALELFSRRR